MKCPTCSADMVKINGAGEPLVRGRGVVLKADGPAMICPKCGGDVPFSPDFAKAMQARILIFFARKP